MGVHEAFYEPRGIHWIQKMGPEWGEEEKEKKGRLLQDFQALAVLQRKSCLFGSFVILQSGMESSKSLGGVYGIARSDPAIPLVNPVQPFHTHTACFDLRQMGFTAIPRKSNETCQARGPVLHKRRLVQATRCLSSLRVQPNLLPRWLFVPLERATSTAGWWGRGRPLVPAGRLLRRNCTLPFQYIPTEHSESVEDEHKQVLWVFVSNQVNN